MKLRGLKVASPHNDTTHEPGVRSLSQSQPVDAGRDSPAGLEPCLVPSCPQRTHFALGDPSSREIEHFQGGRRTAGQRELDS